MISIEKFKQLLGSEAQNLTDKEIEQIRDSQYQLADIAFDMWQEDKKIKKLGSALLRIPCIDD